MIGLTWIKGRSEITLHTLHHSLYLLRSLSLAQRGCTKMRLFGLPMIAVALAFGSASAEQAPNIARGEQLALTHCARCHSIDRTGQSAFPEAPPFRSLHRRYAVEALQEALGEGLFTGHPEMPEFEFTPDQIGDFLAFLKSLE